MDKYYYLYCIKDGVFDNSLYFNKGLKSVSDFIFSKKGKCYKVIWAYNPYGNENFPNFFINEQKGEHFFGNNPEDTSLFFQKHFKTPNFKHLIIEKKI